MKTKTPLVLVALLAPCALAAENGVPNECVKAKVDQAIACGTATVAIGGAVVAPGPATISTAALSTANCFVKTQNAAAACKLATPAKRK